MYIKKFREVYLAKIGEDSTNDILKSASEIIKKTLTEDGNPINETGLIVGKVQSGKTSNFLGIIAEAFENDYFDSVFLIGGVDNDLLKQNQKRVREVFEKITDSENRTNCLVNTSADFLSSDKRKKLGNATSFRRIEDKKIIITVLKNKAHLDGIFQLISEYKDIFDKRSVLIIDDEGDQGSLNANFNTKKTECTNWNSTLKNIRDGLNKFAYISVTATPYANVLIETADVLSPKFVKVTYPGTEYCGLETFHSEEGINNYISFIPESDAIRTRNSKNINLVSNKDIEESLKRAISFFLCSSIDLFNKNISLEKYEMLVNVHEYTTVQNKLTERISNFLIEIFDYSQEYEEDKNNINKNILLDFINLGFSELYGRKIDEENDQDFIKKFCYALEETRAIPINNEQNRSYDNSPQERYLIYVGSKLLSRGVTINNLIVAYITKNAKKNQADTVLQRARWFGYRKKILDNMKIFMTERIAHDYSSIRILENNLWERIEKVSEEQGDVERFLDEIYLELPANMWPTRKSVAKVRTVKTKSWLNQNKWAQTKDIELRYYEEIEAVNKIENFGTNSFPTKEYDSFEEFMRESNNIYGYIKTKIRPDDSDKIFVDGDWKKMPVKVILMKLNSGENSKRSLGNDKVFTIHARGNTTGFDYNDEKKYFGDAKMDKYESNKGKILIQIYKIDFRNKNGDEYLDQIAYSVYIPDFEKSGYTRESVSKTQLDI